MIIKFSKKGQVFTCGKYVIEPFKDKLIVYTDKRPLSFFSNLKDAKKEVKKEVKAGIKMDEWIENLQRSMDISMRTIKTFI